MIAYRQPVTIPEIEEIRGVDAGGVIHTLLEKKLVVTSGRKSVVGRLILYRTSKDFLVHFGLKDVGELPSLKEFEELAKRALGSDVVGEAAPARAAELVPPSGEMQAPAPTDAAPTPGRTSGRGQRGSSRAIHDRPRRHFRTHRTGRRHGDCFTFRSSPGSTACRYPGKRGGRRRFGN